MPSAAGCWVPGTTGACRDSVAGSLAREAGHWARLGEDGQGPHGARAGGSDVAWELVWTGG